MKALRAVGFAKAAAFALEILAQGILNLCVVPQLRAAVLRLLGARLGRNCVVYEVRIINLYRGSFRHLEMGDDCYVGQQCLLDLAAPIRLGRQVTLGPRVVLLTHLNVGYPDHPLQHAFPAQTGSVIVGDGVFIGAASTVLCGTSIGERAFVAAGSVVSKPVAARTLVAGVPAKVLREKIDEAPDPPP
jgi:acetyltransferase-like isoleucine patch superfamily enzyme